MRSNQRAASCRERCDLFFGFQPLKWLTRSSARCLTSRNSLALAGALQFTVLRRCAVNASAVAIWG